MKKNLKSIIAGVFVIAFLAGCASTNDGNDSNNSSNESKKLSVGIVLPTKDEPRWIQDETQFKKLFKEKGYNVEIQFSQGSSATEKQNVENFITKGVKVLVICAQDAAAAASAVEDAKNAGISVISYDRLITDTEAVDYYVTFDSMSVGKAQAEYLINNTSTKNTPLYLYTGASSDNNAFLFFEGAWETIQPKIADGTFVIANSSKALALKDKQTLTRDEQSDIIGQTTTNWDFNAAKTKADSDLTNSSALKGDVAILAPNDGTARSIADVFASDKAIKSYKITGQDAEKASVQYIIDEKQSMTVFKDTRQLASDAIDMAVSILNEETPDTTTTYNNGKKDVPSKQTDTVTVTKDNVKSALVDSEYYTTSDFTGLN